MKGEKDMEELTVTKEKVLSAAKSCGTAKRVLKAMFPEAFEAEKFNSTQENMEITSWGSYKVAHSHCATICEIRDGKLLLIRNVNVKGIETDDEGYIKVKKKA